MAKKKPPKNKLSGRLPTGVTKSPAFSPKSSAPDSSSAAKSKPKSDLPMAGISAQLTQTPSPAQEDPKSSLAKQTETKDLEILVADSPPVSGKKADVLTLASKKAAATAHALQSPSAEKHEKKEASKREGKKPIKSLLPIIGQPTVDPKNAKLPAPKRTVATHKEIAADAPAYKEILKRSIPPSIADSTASPGSQGHSGSSVSVSHDLSKGSLCVDLSAEGCFEDHQQTSTGSSGSSSDTPLSEEGEIPSDDGDEFIEFFSKRHKKRAKANARARGSLIL
ncbi:hypothetical protein F2Q69_00011187 [Brassica cretica]|uniref:Uncharacterized protein n=1 Tax=Brassica cretica TaxID=69181 RepID=A0A8S9R887_BRACR|nr:hypothetical protein F2Q69_00011187 [Brassica cretica]